MSYILDALRKSESQRQLGQPPDLSAAMGPSKPDGGRRGGRLRWLMAGLVLLAVVAIGVLYQAGFMDGPESAAIEQAQVAVPATASDELDPVPDEQTVEPASVERQRRTTVDRRSPAQQPVTSVSRPAPARPGQVTTPPPVVPEEGRERLVTDPQQAMAIIEEQAHPKPEARPVRPASETAAVVAVAEDSVASADPADPDWVPERADYMEVWDLPLSVRRELPELDLSIHVFSGEPSERFVLINGERRLEGASLGGGARLAEIRRQGAIVDFRDYRFLVRP